MSKKVVLPVLTSILLAGCLSTSNVSVNKVKGVPTDVRILVNHIETEEGQLLVYLHDNADSYYSDDNYNESSIKYFHREVIKPSIPATEIVLTNIPAGKYAISVVHDKDSDGTLDRMIFPFIGMPSEPYGLSNDAYRALSKGSFEDAIVDITAEAQPIEIKLATHLSKAFGG
ncbi:MULTISPECIES: DUF2141 domain-containing protein [Pseudoalteromonas]|uniref:DUF2141 domain-containing protein n=1 Tax=Pseudoalteromonas obscura TaxID=3048491 RepID=A0ABT7EGI5_9GAMM|nr:MULTISPECIES: DUF2141 domain-containing protein [Pseudoalteromonas]MBQ4835595.1 DUF2141 domain-containing protein [Pseudoalteromonas luteoviolacea]MDK2594155.1 DUF2141 domain-containing protein [Pseudoalteromonas sp. P94(2023)]